MSARAATSARMFFALWPDGDTALRLDTLGRQLQVQCRGRLTRLNTLHLTLAFVGDVRRDRLDELAGIAREVDAGSFLMHLDLIGSWTRNRIAWAGTRDVPSGLKRLVDDLAGRLRSAGFPLERRPFAPHLTLLRKIAVPFETREIPPVEWPVAEFRLVESVRTSEGAHYRARGRWPLSG